MEAGVAIGGRRLKGKYPWRFPSSFITPMEKLSLIGEIVGKMIFGYWSWGIVVGVGGLGASRLKGTWHRTLPGFGRTPISRIILICETIRNISLMVLKLRVGIGLWGRCWGLGG